MAFGLLSLKGQRSPVGLIPLEGHLGLPYVSGEGLDIGLRVGMGLHGDKYLGAIVILVISKGLFHP